MKLKGTNINLLVFIGTIVFWTVLVFLTPMEQLKREHENQAKISFGTGDSSKNQQEFEKLTNHYKESSTLENFGVAITIYGAAFLLSYLLTHEQLRKRKFYWMALANALFATILSGLYYSQTIRYELDYFSEYTDYYFPIQGLLTILLAYQLFRFLYRAYFLGEEPKFVSQRGFFEDTPNWLFTILVYATGFLTGAFLNPMERINWLIVNFA